MKLEFESNLKTVYEATSQRFKTVSTFRRLYKLGFLVGPLLGVLFWKLGVVRIEINNSRLIIVELCEAIIIGSVVWFVLWFLLCCNFKRIWIKALYSEIAERDMANENRLIELNKDGVVWKSPHMNQFLNWKVFTKIHETKDFIYLEHIHGSLLWVPKASFQNNEQAIAFLKLAKSLFEQNK
jgi:hypothetical protein